MRPTLFAILLTLIIPSPAYAAPTLPFTVYLPTVTVPATAGGVRWLNCNYGQAGRVVWFAGGAGRLITVWTFQNFFGIQTSESRIKIIPGRGQMFAEMRPKFGYYLVHVEWGFDGAAFVETSFCGA